MTNPLTVIEFAGIAALSVIMIVMFILSFIALLAGEYSWALKLFAIAIVIDAAFAILSYQYVINQGSKSPCNYITPPIACIDQTSPYEQYNHVHPLYWVANIEYYYGALITGSHTDTSPK